MTVERGLREWQAHLAAHFKELRESRVKDGLGRPVFGLEHGLDSAEVQDLEQAIRGEIRYRRPSRLHSLVWVVYSSELGYRYSGDEYWQTFEQETPSWIGNGDRYALRNFFRLFQREYGGAEPSGAWAEHFSIICWPITHAILPRDLQLQLARTLYELRYRFSRDILESTDALGELIAAKSWDARPRFQNFLQEKDLVGQIAAALLLRDEFGSSNLIHPKTLERISEDVGRHQQAREWLRSARQSAGERVRTRSIGLPRQATTPPGPSTLDKARAEVTQLGIEPRLILRREGSLDDSWDVLLEIPDLSHLLLRFPQTTEVLSGSRCTVAGSSGRPLARGRLLYGAQRIRLQQWPQWDKVLLQFERSDPQLDFLLRTECLLRPGPKWLFRIASDGLAYESRSLRVRPGERYILVSTTGQVSSDQHIAVTNLNCEDVQGALLDLPEALTPDWEEALRRLGIDQSRTVEVWPAGLAPVAWDGDGYGEWLETEAPCLAILSDHPLETLNVSIDTVENSVFELTPVDPGEPVFLELPQLPVGVHGLHISARNVAGVPYGLLGELDVVIRIRERRPQSQRVSPIGPLWVHMEPPSATLEQLWEGQVDLSLQGPTGRGVEISVSFGGSNVDSSTFTWHLPPLSLPFQSADWRSHFGKHLQTNTEAQNAYDLARSCTLEFDAGELGQFEISYERAFTPLRWAVRRRRNGYLVRLIDDRGDPEPAAMSRWDFETPCVEESINFDSDAQFQESGGMFVAGTDESRSAIIIPPVPNRMGLKDLRLVPSIERYERSMESIGKLVDVMCLWASARLPGDLLSAMRQRNVVRGLLDELSRLFCRDHWARAERQSVEKGTLDALRPLTDLVSPRREHIGLGRSLFSRVEEFARAGCDERAHILSSLMGEYGLFRPSVRRERASQTAIDDRNSTISDNPEWLAEFLLRLSTDPGHVGFWAGENLKVGLAHLLDTPTLAKSARYLVLATDCYFRAESKAGGLEPYDGWKWNEAFEQI